jgi:adenylate cyclase
MAVDPEGVDVEELLGDLEGLARQERAEPISWLLAHGYDTDQIRSAYSPMLLPANRVIGEDGTGGIGKGDRRVHWCGP